MPEARRFTNITFFMASLLGKYSISNSLNVSFSQAKTWQKWTLQFSMQIQFNYSFFTFTSTSLQHKTDVEREKWNTKWKARHNIIFKEMTNLFDVTFFTVKCVPLYILCKFRIKSYHLKSWSITTCKVIRGKALH